MIEKKLINELLDDPDWVLRVRTAVRLSGREDVVEATCRFVNWDTHRAGNSMERIRFMDGVYKMLGKR